MKTSRITYHLPPSLLFSVSVFLILCFLLWFTDTLSGQASGGTSVSSSPGLELTLSMDGWFPQIIDKETGITYAFGSTAQAHLLRWGSFSLLARGGVYSIQTDTDISMFYLGGAAGLGYFRPLTERIGVGAFGFAGLGNIPDIKTPGIEEKSYGLYELGARLSASLRLTASMNLDIFAGYQRLATPVNSFIDAPAAGIGLRIAPAELLRSRGHLDFGEIQADPVFPVLRSWYDSEPLGTVTIENREDGPIEKVRVFFHVPEYMGGSRLCASLPRLDPGEKLEVPLFAVFDERILSLTENSRTNALVDVEYSFYGSERTAAETFPLSIYHRNTMTWEDDRRAAAFVSPTDPASLWFARYSGSIARDRMRGNLPRNLQHALSIFEGLRLYGVNYVIDPNSAYEELSEDATAIDFLQYPSETLMYRGGDCDDLSILYSSLLESTGISTAFITIPGHIYMAFDLGMSAQEAQEQFFDPGLLIIRDNRAWAPIEITMVREGFVKAWRVGAKQWMDNDAAGRADFFPMRENWKHYPPSALPGAESRFVLPEESELMVAFDESINRFMTREIGPVISDFRDRLARQRDPEILNEYGVALAKAGMLDESWEHFSEAADEGYVWAWNNLASVAFIRKDYDLAYSYYEWAQELLPGDPVATLGLARSAYEMDRYRESEVLYNRLLAGAPSLADRFNYLQSVYGGSGRAYSMTDRLTTTVWSEKDLDFGSAGEKLAVAEAGADDITEPAAAEAPEPAVESESGTGAEVELEQETAFETEPEAEPEPEPDPKPQPAPEPERVAKIKPDLPAGEEQEQEELEIDGGEIFEKPEEESEAAETASAEEQKKPAAAPPKIERKAPVDSEIASLMQRSQQNALSASLVPPPEPEEEASIEKRSPGAPPTIAEKAPEDVEIVQMRVVDETPKVAPPEEPEPEPEAREEEAEPVSEGESESVPEPAPEPEPERVATTEPEREPEPEPEPETKPETEPEQKVEPEASVRVAQAPESEPEPAPVPEPVVDREPEGEIKVAQAEPEPEPEAKLELEVEPEPEPEPMQIERVKLVGQEVRSPTGKWALEDYNAAMTDEGAYYAKLVLPPKPITGPAEYRFKARSTGSGFAGFGIHIHGQENSDQWKWKFTQFGGGDSILIWITSDPKHYGDAAPRLQLYRSYGEVAMEMTDSVRIPGSAFDLRDYTVAYDPGAGTIRVSVDGREYLSAEGFANPDDFDYILLRALDTAEFYDLSVQPLHQDDHEEKRDE